MSSEHGLGGGPLLLILSSPSGAGKSTLTRRVRDQIDNLEFSVSHTRVRRAQANRTAASTTS